MSEQHRALDIGAPDASRCILWIHGYTGSPDAFRGIAERLSATLNARVVAPLLPGHGTFEKDLPPHTFDEFLSVARINLEKCNASSKKVAIVGYSFGGYLATILANESGADALCLALTPYELRRKFKVPGLAQILALRPFWSKYLNAEDKRIREGTFYYPNLPGKSLSLIGEGNARIEKILPNIRMPILTIHNSTDPLASPNSGNKILAAVASKEKEAHVLLGGRHALFFRPRHEQEEKLLTEFLKKYL